MQNATTTATFVVPRAQEIIIIYLPIVFLTLFCPVDIYFIYRSRYRSIPWNTHSVAKVVLTLVLSIVTCVVLTADSHSTKDWLKLVCNAVVIGLTVAHRNKGVRSSSLVLVFWLLSLASAGLSRLFLPMSDSGCRLVEVEILLLVVLVLLFGISDRRPEYHNIDEKSPSQEQTNYSPEMRASAGNKMLFLWFFQLTYLSLRGQLDEQRVWSLDPEMKCEYFVAEFTDTVTRLLQKSELALWRLKVSFFVIIVRTFSELVLVATFQRLFLIIAFFVCPFILRELISYAKTGGTYQLGLYYSLILCAVSFLIAILNGQYAYNNKKFTMQTWSALVSTVFKKAMRINDHAELKEGQKRDVGVIINLMMSDADKFGQLCMILNTAWSTVVIIVAASFCLWTVLGWSFLSGLAVIVGVIVANYFLVKRLDVLQKDKMYLKDRRIKLTDEILEGIKILKYYGWEQCFQKHLSVIRINEIDALRTIGYINLVKYVLWILAPFMISLVSFATYVWSEPTESLTVEKAFVSITLFNIIRFPLTSMPATISQISELWVSTGRIIDFLRTEDYLVRKSMAKSGDIVATIRNGSFSWTNFKSALQDINMTVRESQLIAVCGKVASGKSSLVAAFLGDINCTEGDVRIRGTVAYVPQEPWIQHNTVRSNILFGQQMNEGLYNRVIDACELREDLAALPNGDTTEIGERGINLSGGQKQRIALARAIYQQADFYLLDDPLSAVDFQVGRRIFDQSIGPSGLLKQKARILVTHDIHAVKAATEVYELRACGQLRQLDAREPLITLATNSITEKTEPRPNKAKQEFQRVENLVGKERLDHGINVLNNLVFYIAKMRTYRFVVICCLAIGYHALAVWANIWLSKWASDAKDNQLWYLGIYFVFGIGQGLALLLLGWATLKGGIRASKTLHSAMLGKILKVPLSFFSENPSGRIINRFSQDMDKIDVTLPTSVRDGIMACISVLSVFVLFVSTNLNFTFALLVFLAFVACLFLLWLHLSTSKLLKRLTSITQSPIISHVKESLNGKSTIRAFNTTAQFIDELEAKIDHHQKFNYLFAASQCWQTVWLELIGATIITIVTLFVTLSDRDGMSPAKVGLVLTYALSFIQQLQALFMRTAEIETNTVAVERCKEYTKLQSEEGLSEDGERPEDWPSNGRIEFKNFCMAYRTDYPDVLKDIDLTIDGGQKIGIIGRTGAGKSSLISALIRMIKHTKGTITIDGRDISTISLQHLRQQITIVPQDAVLFTDNLRFNLDPTNAHSDEELIDILEKCRLTPLLERNNNTLSFPIDGKNNNLSVGEKQMICLARALLRKSKVMIFDEATSSVDDNNEQHLQQVIENDLRDCTVLTIAHRLDNVKDSDRIVVIDNGVVTECDKPENLLENVNSYFYKSLHAQ